jgi:hypothetical protein
MTFGLITEGPTDQVVLRHILARFFSPDIDTRPVQPNVDSTDEIDHFGSWVKVLGYCKSADMSAALEVNDFVIIQIDTDVCQEYGVQKREGGRDITDDEIVEKVKAVIIDNIGVGLYGQFSQKIIFAISHDSIECWLLPLYFTNNNRAKTTNCCDTLNQELRKRDFTIDCNKKRTIEYKKICKEIKSKAIIENISVHNSSFNQFIQRLAII